MGVKAEIMQPGVNLVQTEDSTSRHALKVLAEDGERPYLATFKVVQMKRGSTELWTKTSLNDTTWTAYSVLKGRISPFLFLKEKLFELYGIFTVAFIKYKKY